MAPLNYPSLIPQVPKRELQAEITRLHDEGLSLREIARQIGLHWTRIWQILK